MAGFGAIRIFGLGASRVLAGQMAEGLDIPLAEHEERDFEDGEHKARPLTAVRGADVYVVHSLYGDDDDSVNDKLCKLLFFLGAIRDAGAARVTAVVPYLAYARKDRRTKPRDPLTTRYVAALFEAVGVDAVMCMEVHNLAAFENAFRCRTHHLDSAPLFIQWLLTHLAGDVPVVLSPDAGGMKRADLFRDYLGAALGREIPVAFMEKQRSEGRVTGKAFVGDVEDRTVVIVDDLISSGTTLARAAAASREQGAKRVFAVAAHGLFVKDANSVMADPALDQVLISDSVPPFRLEPALVGSKVIPISTAAYMAEAVRRLHADEPVEELASEWPPGMDV